VLDLVDQVDLAMNDAALEGSLDDGDGRLLLLQVERRGA